MTQHWTENSTRLKLLVGGMTTLLVIGLILLVVGIARTSKELTEQSEQLAAKIGDVPVKMAPGDTLINLSADNGKLYLAIRHGDGTQSVLVLDAKNGKQLGRLELETSP
ncbi:MAG: hypothetical protein HOA08_19215 [Rhodospirillaceae bacterium]|jgi:hypothetical protein|nr:hypothetical protein [Rhodospirillaceae bacterium]MBT3491651.1 hypothetical protein [Rhodospirillaceae bacterium]MBT3783293.1 hypothetical protein [Rhodospirillaceae bacterium]MBT3978289.1 hypothetical protein [Rhodospirillaceae bacterium]MBT4167388.1 hypothetical protein [Rhodospirillaceae bacterium]